MANYNDLITAIDSVIKTNNRREITGQLLQNVLNTMVGSLGENYQLAGFATPTTNPHQPDQNVFYVASQAGVYTQFDNIVLGDGISFLMWKNGAWTSQTISIVTQSWVQQNFVSKEWFRKVFRVYDEDGLEIVPNDMDSVVDNIKAMVGLWTNEYLSALGMGRDGGGTTQTLAQLNDVQLGTLANGDALVYNTAIHKWENKQIQAGVDMSVVWAALAANTNEQINASHLTTALSGYVTTEALGTTLQNYATQSWVNQNYATQSWVNQNFITVEWFDKLFQLYNGTEAEANKIAPNGALPVDQTQLNIEAMFGFWTKKYISSLGKGDDGTTSYNTLAQLNDVTLTNPTTNQILVYDGTHWRNQNQQSVYELPAATTTALGGIKVGYITSGKNYKVQLDASNNAYVNVPWTDTTYTLAGLMGSTAKGSTTQPIYWNGSEFANTTYTLGAACAKGVTDNSSNADVTSSDTNLITGRTLYYQLAKKGYTTNTGTVTSVATGTGLKGGTITTSGTISINSTYQTYISHGESAYNSLRNYLPLAGGTMTGTLKLTTGIGIEDSLYGGLLVCKPTNWTGITSSQWGVGAGMQGVIRSNNTPLIHFRISGSSGTAYEIIDSKGGQTINSSLQIGSSNGAYLQIGAIRLVYDSSNNAVKVIKSDGGNANLYATGGVSALGVGQESGGGGGAYDAEIEYLEGTGAQWIDTGIAAKDVTKAELQCFCSTGRNNTVFGNTTTSIAAGAPASIWSESTGLKYYSAGQSTISIGAYNTIINAELNIPTNSVNSNIYIFKANGYNGETGFKCYRCKLYNGTTLVRDFIPVRVGNVGYLYDRVSGELFGNAGTGSFVLGQDTGSGGGGGGDVTWALLASPATGGRRIHSSYISSTLSNYATVSSLGEYMKVTPTNAAYNANNIYDAGLYELSGGSSNLPFGAQYGVILSLPYRNAYGNTRTDFTSQIALPNGDDSSYPNSMFYRTSLSSSWNAWQRVQNVSMSDVRLKTILSNPTFDIRQIANAPIIRYKWSKEGYGDKKVHIGSTAQYWMNVANEFVDKEFDGYYSLQYGVAALISAITVARKVMTHEEKIALLETRVSALEKENGEQEMLINSLQEELAKFKAA